MYKSLYFHPFGGEGMVMFSWMDPFYGTGLFIGYENANHDGWWVNLCVGTDQPMFHKYTFDEMYGDEPFYDGSELD